MGIRTINTICLELFKVLTLVTLLFRVCQGLLSTLNADDFLNEVPCPPPFLPNKKLIVQQLAKEQNLTEHEINVIVTRCRLDKNNSTVLRPKVSSLALLCKAATCYKTSSDSTEIKNNSHNTNATNNTDNMGELCINREVVIFTIVVVCLIVLGAMVFLIRHYSSVLLRQIRQLRQRLFKSRTKTRSNDPRIEENHEMLQDASKEMDLIFKPKYLYDKD